MVHQVSCSLVVRYFRCGDNYSGVGLELFGSTGSFFRYRSDPTLEIVTKQFFVGTSGSGEPEQYISGSKEM